MTDRQEKVYAVAIEATVRKTITVKAGDEDSAVEQAHDHDRGPTDLRKEA